MSPNEPEQQFIEVDTSLARIKGQIAASSCGKQVAKFLGVPHAQQPVGELSSKPLHPLKLPLGTKELPYHALSYGIRVYKKWMYHFRHNSKQVKTVFG